MYPGNDLFGVWCVEKGRPFAMVPFMICLHCSSIMLLTSPCADVSPPFAMRCYGELSICTKPYSRKNGRVNCLRPVCWFVVHSDLFVFRISNRVRRTAATPMCVRVFACLCDRPKCTRTNVAHPRAAAARDFAQCCCKSVPLMGNPTLNGTRTTRHETARHSSFCCAYALVCQQARGAFTRDGGRAVSIVFNGRCSFRRAPNDMRNCLSDPSAKRRIST